MEKAGLRRPFYFAAANSGKIGGIFPILLTR
jgi:hypothetical protein